MNAKYDFTTAKTLRTALVYFLLFLAGDLLSSLPFDFLFSFLTLPSRELYAIFRMSGCLLLTMFLFWLYTTRFLHLQMRDFGITFRLQAGAVVLSVLLPVFVAGSFALIGRVEVHTVSAGTAFLLAAASAVTALKAGILEEMLFRGFVMRLAESRWNKYAAILAPSFLFSLAHIPAMEEITAGGVFLLILSGTLVGVMFSLLAYRSESVSSSILMHTIWNFAMVTSICHITTEQGAYGEPLVSIFIPSDHILLTGAGFGAEASVISVMGYALVCLALLLPRGNGTKPAGRTR